MNSYPLYLGVPRIGNRTGAKLANLKTQWKQFGTGVMWNDHTVECVGRVWLRLFDTEKNIEIFRRQVVVLPKSFCIERTIGLGTEAGTYRLQGLMGALVSDGNSEKIEQTDDGVSIGYPALHSTHLPPITLKLSWAMGKEVSVNLPYPQRGAVFQLAGQTLARDETVSLERLGGLRLFLLDHAGGRRYWLDVELISADALDCELPRLRFRDRLPILVSGRLETSMLAWQDRIASLLSSSRSLDALVRLEVSTSQGETVARVNIARFDCFLEPNFPAHQIRLSASTLEKIGPAHLKNIHLEMFPLWSPKDQPIPLEEPFPALETSFRIDLTTQRVEKTQLSNLVKSAHLASQGVITQRRCAKLSAIYTINRDCRTTGFIRRYHQDWLQTSLGCINTRQGLSNHRLPICADWQ